ncbi:peptidase M50 family protein, partial [Trifolium medium]|nr:peptidase M50 family protein [Trifolium medium]
MHSGLYGATESKMDLQFESTNMSNPFGYLSAIALAVTTFGTVALMSGFFLKPDTTFDDYPANVVPLFGGFLFIHGVSELVATRVTAARYGVKLSPLFLVPSNWTGCLGGMNNYESLLPNKKALFDIPVAHDLGNVLPYAVEGVGVPVDPPAFAGLL